MAIEDELQQLNAQLKRNNDALERLITKLDGASVPEGNDSGEKPAQTDAGEQTSQGQKAAAKKSGAKKSTGKKSTGSQSKSADSDPMADPDPTPEPESGPKVTRKEASEELLNLIAVVGRQRAVEVLQEFDAKVLKDIPDDRLGMFYERCKQAEAGNA